MWTCYLLLFYSVTLKGTLLDSAVVLLATSLCQALCLQPDGTCSGVGNQSEKSYWKVHKISSGICMFESVRNAQMYLRIKDGQCDGTVSICSYFSQHMLKTFANNIWEWHFLSISFFSFNLWSFCKLDVIYVGLPWLVFLMSGEGSWMLDMIREGSWPFRHCFWELC